MIVYDRADADSTTKVCTSLIKTNCLCVRELYFERELLLVVVQTRPEHSFVVCVHSMNPAESYHGGMSTSNEMKMQFLT